MLPYDIVAKMVPYLWHAVSNTDDDETPAFLCVSKHWRRAILEATPFLFYRFLDRDRNKDLSIPYQFRIRRMDIVTYHVPCRQVLWYVVGYLQHLRIGKALFRFFFSMYLKCLKYNGDTDDRIQ